MQRMKDRLCKSELWGIMALLVFHVFLFPVGASWGYAVGLIPSSVTDSELNVIYYSIGLILTFAFAGKYLRRSFDSFLDDALNSALCVVVAWAVYLVLFLIVNTLVDNLEILSSGNPNQQTIEGIAQMNTKYLLAFSVLMAPIVEEVIFRGGLFCGLYHKNRIAAYAVSVVAFALYHVWQYAFYSGDLHALIFAVQYIPAGIALCWCYERSGSIWACILFHMSINLWSLSFL